MDHILTKDGRVFFLHDIKPHTRKDGTSTEIKIWGGFCRKCGSVFEVATPKAVTEYGQSNSFGIVHCELHRLSGGDRRGPSARYSAMWVIFRNVVDEFAGARTALHIFRIVRARGNAKGIPLPRSDNMRRVILKRCDELGIK